jgi:hypothetical protein
MNELRLKDGIDLNVRFISSEIDRKLTVGTYLHSLVLGHVTLCHVTH